MAALALAITSLMVGSPKEYERAIRFIDGLRDHAWPGATWGPALTFPPRTLRDARPLAPDGVGRYPSALDTAESGLRRFNCWPLKVWISRFTGILWGEPGKALAELQRQDRDLALVPAARLKLFARDLAGATAAAEEGLYSLRVPLHERAHLEVMKAASLMLSGAPSPAVAALVDAACRVCQESGTVLSFAMLPAALREQLREHQTHHNSDGPCILTQALLAGVFDQLVSKEGSAARSGDSG